MAADETFICNQALGLLGSGKIMSLDDESKEARFCQRFYEQTRNEVIAGHRWNFAIQRAELSRLTEEPLSEWEHQYQLPTDCLRVLQLNGFAETENASRFVIEGRRLLTDDDRAVIRYLRSVEDATLFPPLFIEALAVRLAAKLAQPLTGSRSMPGELYQEYLRVTGPKARRADAFEGQPKTKPEWVTSPLVRSRFGG